LNCFADWDSFLQLINAHKFAFFQVGSEIFEFKILLLSSISWFKSGVVNFLYSIGIFRFIVAMLDSKLGQLFHILFCFALEALSIVTCVHADFHFSKTNLGCSRTLHLERSVESRCLLALVELLNVWNFIFVI